MKLRLPKTKRRKWRPKQGQLFMLIVAMPPSGGASPTTGSCRPPATVGLALYGLYPSVNSEGTQISSYRNSP